MEIGSATNGTKAFVDTSSIRAQPDRNEVEVFQRFIMPSDGGTGLRRAEQRVVYSCREGTMKVLRDVGYGPANTLLYDERLRTAATPVREGSLPELIREAIC
ncbi:MAG TPA: surface-adhesin E family protein [Allosphingosinicella sp.]|uniref:surface-adhesin E family protein n=1 Tax=Allosphingosinicella sp. TaxID=2823234 RepID=UPI002ED8E137